MLRPIGPQHPVHLGVLPMRARTRDASVVGVTEVVGVSFDLRSDVFHVERPHLLDDLRAGLRFVVGTPWLLATVLFATGAVHHALIDAGLAEMPEVFLPFAVTKKGSTLYSEIQENTQLFLSDKP